MLLFDINLLNFHIEEFCAPNTTILLSAQHSNSIDFRLARAEGRYRLLQSRMQDGVLYMLFTATYLGKDTCSNTLRGMSGANFHTHIRRIDGAGSDIKNVIPHDYVCTHSQMERISEDDKRSSKYLITCEYYIHLVFKPPCIMQLVKEKVETVEI